LTDLPRNLRGLILSAAELQDMHPDWSSAMIEDYLNIFENIINLTEGIDASIPTIPAAIEDNIATFDDVGGAQDSGVDIFEVLLIANVLGEPQEIDVTNNHDQTITISISTFYLINSIFGTSNQITVTDNLDGSVTLSTPQNIDTDADVTFDTLILDQLKIVLDNGKILFGLGDDASIYYDGTDLNIKTDEVAPSDLKIECGSEKTVELQNIVYDDWFFEIAPKTVGAGKPTLAAFSGNINQWQMGISDITELRPLEMAHRWKEATAIEVHVHWATNGLDATDRGVKWEIDYTWANDSGSGVPTAFAAATTVSAETLIPASTPDKTNIYTSVVSFTPVGGKIGAVLLMSLKRIASVTNPTPSNDPWVLMVGVHYQANTMGSRQMRTK